MDVQALSTAVTGAVMSAMMACGLGENGIGVTEASGDSEHPGRPIDPRRFTEIAPGPEGKRDAGGLQEGGAS